MHPHRANSLLRKLLCTLLFTNLLTAAIGINTHAHGDMPQLEETASSGKFQLVVKVSPHAAYQTEAIFVDKKLQRELEDGGTGAPFVAPLPPDTTLSFDKKGELQRYGVTPNGEVVDLSARLTLNISSTAQETLRSQVQMVRARHYGEILPWEEASEVLPKYSKFTIVDVESGLSFEGQRRAGSHHADVQPLTKSDSATLKTIYGGAWSWDRKAVLVKLNGRTLAGSMHGMPHGGGWYTGK